MNKEEKLKALDAAISRIEKDYGKGSVMKLGDRSSMDVETVPTGSLSLDIALGLGGIPKGRIIEIYGPESSGKTTVTLHMVAEVQKRGGIAGFIDAEHALDPKYAQSIGVDVDNLYVSQPDYGEQALEICETMVRSGALDIIVIDSVAALTPKKEIDGEMGDATVGLQARLMSQALRKLTAVVDKTKCSVIFINQIREKIGVFYGPSETTTGGRALKFYSTIRMEVRKGDLVAKIDDEVYVEKYKQAEANYKRALLNQKNAKASLNARDSEVSLARADLERYSALYEKGAVSKQVYDKAKTNYEAALAAQVKAKEDIFSDGNNVADADLKALEAVMKQAKLNLEYTRVIAPNSGVVTNRRIEKGSFVLLFKKFNK